MITANLSDSPTVLTINEVLLAHYELKLYRINPPVSTAQGD